MTSLTSLCNLFLLIALSASGFVGGSNRKFVGGSRQQLSPTAAGPLPRQVSFNISEGLPVGTLVGVLPTGIGNVGVGVPKFSVLAQYVDEASGASSGGSTNGGDTGSNNLLSVNATSGAIVTSRVLDRERLCSGRSSTRCDVRLDVAVSPGFSVIRVMVSIDDVNDNAPTFRDRKLTRHVTESAQTGPVFQLPAAHDADGGSGNGISGYRLEPETSPFALRVAGGTGSDVFVELLRSLDRETTDRYQLTLTAYDGGSPRLSGSVDIDVIVLDANDNTPQFINVTAGHVIGGGRDGSAGVGYDVTLPASSPVGTDVITVTAIDPDLEENGAVRYRFAAKTQSRYGWMFSINPESGLIRTTSERLEFGATSTLTLVVLAEDRGQNSVASSVAVTVRAAEMNEHAPLINVDTLIPGRAEIAENSPPNTFIAHVVATDADTGRGGEVDCYLDATSPTDPTPQFALIPLYGTEYKLVSTVSFDRESRDRYDVTLRCHDGGQPPLTSSVDVQIVVTDVDDNPPAFASPSYNFTLHENNARGQTIGRVTASDADFPGPNGVVVYSLDPEADVDAWFAVDPTTGVLTARVPFDREFVDRFEFDVIASSASASTSGTASSKSVSSPAKTGIAQVARTRVRVTVTDLDDEPPRFARSWYRFDVAENQSGGTEVGRVTAVDEDLPPFDGFLYHLETAAGDEKGTGTEGGGSPFAVDPVSGIIYTRRTLDREALSHYTLRIRAQSDSAPTGNAGASSASPPLSDVTIVFVRVTDVNDNAPEVTYPTSTDNTIRVRRRSDVKAGATVAVVTAHDRDAGVNAALSFSIIDGNERGRFLIETTTGIIRWAVNEADLYESSVPAGRSGDSKKTDSVGDCSWTLSVQVKDGGVVNKLSTTARLNVVLDGCLTVGASEAKTQETAYRLAAVSAGHSGGTGSRQLLPGLTDWYLFVVVVVIACCIVVIGALITIVITVRQCSRRRKQNTSRQTTLQKDCGGSTSAGSSAGGSDPGDVQLTLLRSNVDLQSYSPSGGSDDAVSTAGGGGGGSIGLNTEQLLLHVIEGQKLESRDIAGLILALRQAQLRSRYQDSRLQIPRDRDTDSGCVDLSPVI